jgi:hypothetical protein
MHTQSNRVGCLHPWHGCLHPWHGWTVHTHSGDKVGSVNGQFDTGPHAGLLRVHRARTDGTAVFAIPVSAVATSDYGRIVLTHGATPALADWLAYVIRRYGMVPIPSPSPIDGF